MYESEIKKEDMGDRMRKPNRSQTRVLEGMKRIEEKNTERDEGKNFRGLMKD